MADFSRYIYNDRQSLFSVLGIAVGSPLVWVIAAYLSVRTGEVDIILIMKNYALVLPAFILIFVSAWVTNATNLYSVALTSATIYENPVTVDFLYLQVYLVQQQLYSDFLITSWTS